MKYQLRKTTVQCAGWVVLLVVLAGAGRAAAQGQQAGTPARSARTQSEAIEVVTRLANSGPSVGVLAYCTDLQGSVGAQNTVNTLVADGRFGTVTLIDADAQPPTAAQLAARFQCVIAMTDNRCGGIGSPSQPLAAYAAGGGGVVISTFGFATGIGFDAPIFGPGLSPFQRVQAANASAGPVQLPGVGAGIPACDRMLSGVSSASAFYANEVALSSGASLCANYVSGRGFLAINAAGNVVGLNSFPADQSSTAQPGYRRLLGNVVNEVCGVVVALDVKPGSCRNPFNVKQRGVLPVAILGAFDFDVTQIDVSTIRLEGVAPLRWSLEDVAAPFEGAIQNPPGAFDCTDAGRDGFLDLTLKFEAQAITAALGPVADRQVRLLTLTGNLLPAFGGRSIRGQDVVVTLVKP